MGIASVDQVLSVQSQVPTRDMTGKIPLSLRADGRYDMLCCMRCLLEDKAIR